MKDGFIRIAAATPKLFLGNPPKNKEAHVATARAAAENDVKILVFPELSLCGYTLADLYFQNAILDASEKALAEYAKETEGLDILTFVGLPVRHKDKLYNVAAAVSNGKILGFVPKTNLPNYGEFGEVRQFTAAPAETETVRFAGTLVPMGTKILFTCDEIRSLCVGAEICEDLWVPSSPSLLHTAAGATVIANLSASDELVGKSDYRRSLVAAQSARTLSAYIYASAGEGESGTDAVYAGHDLIADNGKIVAERLPFAAENYVSAVIDVDRLAVERRKKNTYKVMNAGYTEIPFRLAVTETALSEFPKLPFVPQSESESRARCAEILSIQSHALAGRMERAYAKSAVVGLSGGLDSTLAILVAVRAADLIGLPRTAITAVTMPGFGTTVRTKGNAEKLAESLGTTLRTIPIGDAVRQHFLDIGHDENDKNVVYENAQARERTQILMDIANENGGLVIGTGDLSELALGFATYNGDHMSMYGVNAGVPKTLIRTIVSYAADVAEENGDTILAEVLRDILATPVSPELLPPKDGEIAQCTEGIVGPYELHDFFLYHMLRFGFSPKKLFRIACVSFADTYSPEVILGWLRMFIRRFFTQQFKRSCIPDGPKIGSVALSPRGDFRMPSDVSASFFLAELDEIKL